MKHSQLVIAAFVALFSTACTQSVEPEPELPLYSAPSEAPLSCADQVIAISNYQVHQSPGDGLNLDGAISDRGREFGTPAMACDHDDGIGDDGTRGTDRQMAELLRFFREFTGVDVVEPTRTRSEGMVEVVIRDARLEESEEPEARCLVDVALNVDGREMSLGAGEIVDGYLVARATSVELPIFLQDKNLESFDATASFSDVVLLLDETGGTLGGFVDVDWVADLMRRIDDQLATEGDTDLATSLARSWADDDVVDGLCRRVSASIGLNR